MRFIPADSVVQINQERPVKKLRLPTATKQVTIAETKKTVTCLLNYGEL